MQNKHIIFAYGTLLDKHTQEELFDSQPDHLGEAVLYDWEKLENEEYPYIRPKQGSQVPGELMELNDPQLKAADVWEVVPTLYQRELLMVYRKSGGSVLAWVYTRR